MDLQSTLTVESSGEKTQAPCECCGKVTRTNWGYVHRESGATVASYFVSWLVGNRARDAYIDLIIGRWGDGATTRALDVTGHVPRFRCVYERLTFRGALEPSSALW